MENIIVIAVVAVIIGLAAGYVIRAKKRGKKCIGCPACKPGANQGCGGSCSCCSGCGTTGPTKE